MTATVSHFISMEVGHLIDAIFRGSPFAAGRQVTSVTVVNIEVIVYVTVEIGTAMIPRPDADEPSVDKPFRAVIAVGRTTIGCVVIIAVRTHRLRSDLDTDLSV
jgi:hypothetical protein